MDLTTLARATSFRDHGATIRSLRDACEEHGDLAVFEVLGESEEGRPLCACILGRGRRAVSLVAGAHADEPVGPETLRTLVPALLRQRDAFADLLDAYQFVIVPHVNPDGEARNRAWMDEWPDAGAYLKHRVRELPGRDVEFGYPSMRVENELVTGLLRRYAPFVLHMSLHAMLLIERHWTFRTQSLRDRFVDAAHRLGVGLHDHNRKGEKGFFYVEPGFWTTPEGAAMRTYFEAQGDSETAARFHSTSMELVRSLGGDPLCLVTEVPLFVLERQEEHQPGVARTAQRFGEEKAELTLRLERGESVDERLAAYGVRAVPVERAMQLQLTALEAGLHAVE